jgi:uncharacterized protein YqeY
MVSLKQTLVDDMRDAMRARDSDRLDTIRLLRAAIQRREVDERIELDDAGVVTVVHKLIKQGRDAAAQFEQGGRADLVAKEQQGIEVLDKYLPAALAPAEVAALVDAAFSETGAASMADMGAVMGWLKPRLQGRADMGAVSALVKARLLIGRSSD